MKSVEKKIIRNVFPMNILKLFERIFISFNKNQIALFSLTLASSRHSSMLNLID